MWIVQLARTLWEAWHTASRRSAGRRDLRRLDDRLLRDVGISREQALREAEKPFWRR